MKEHGHIPAILWLLFSLIIYGESSIFVRKPRQVDSVPQSDSKSDRVIISNMTITSTVSVRFADVSVRSVVVNEKLGEDEEVRFSVQLPLTAFISEFTMTIEGVKYAGEVMGKETAKKLYEEAQASNETAGLVIQDTTSPTKRLDMDMFSTSLNVAANSAVVFELKYQELIERRNGFYKQTLNIQPYQIVPRFNVLLTYYEPQSISSFSYTLPRKPNTVDIEGPFDATDVTITADAAYRRMHFTLTEEKQALFNPVTGVQGDLVIKYDVDHTDSLFSMTLVGPDYGPNGYVATYFSPPPDAYEVLPKDIVFVIDISGSMSGKIEQVRDSMLDIFKKIRPVDRFNIILFDNSIEVFSDGFHPGTEDYLLQAEMYVMEYVKADGSTNINDALMQAISLFGPHLQDPRGNIIILLTDGNPNSGAATKPADIRANVRETNYVFSYTGIIEFKAVIYALGFGFDMDFEFLTNLADENGGNARRIYEGVDARDQLVFFFDEIADPFLTDVTVSLCTGSTENLIPVEDNRISKHEYPYYFSGSELVIVARMESLPASYGVCLKGQSSTGQVNLYYPSDTDSTQHLSTEFIKRLYGYMQIKNLLRLNGITLDENAATRYTQLALNMSLEYNFVTPLTSLVVTKTMRKTRPPPRGEYKYTAGGINRKLSVHRKLSVQTNSVADSYPTAHTEGTRNTAHISLYVWKVISAIIIFGLMLAG